MKSRMSVHFEVRLNDFIDKQVLAIHFRYSFFRKIIENQCKEVKIEPNNQILVEHCLFHDFSQLTRFFTKQRLNWGNFFWDSRYNC